MELLSKCLINPFSTYFFGFNKPHYVLSAICMFFLISCGPSIEMMQKSIDEFNSRPDYYVSLKDLLKSQSPIVLNETDKISGELNENDKILLIKGKIEKTYFDIYQINNQSDCKVNFSVRTDPKISLNPPHWQMIPKLYLFSNTDLNNFCCSSNYYSDVISFVSQMICSLKQNTIYYILVYSYLPDSMTFTHRYGWDFTLPVSLYHEGKYTLETNKK